MDPFFGKRLKVETIQMSIYRLKAKQIAIYPCRILLSNMKEQTIDSIDTWLNLKRIMLSKRNQTPLQKKEDKSMSSFL